MSITYFGPVNRCIYCGADDCRLTDEHIVPFGLGGTAVLKKASCIPCGVITGKFEGVVQRGIFGDYRILRDMPTRNKKERPKTKVISVVDATGRKAFDLAPNFYPALSSLRLLIMPFWAGDAKAMGA